MGERTDFYVYVYEDDGKPFYVGKGCGSRDVNHAKPHKKNGRYLNNKLKQLAKAGRQPTIRRLLDGLTEQESHAMEEFFILSLGRRNIGTGCLCNLTNGGEGNAGRVVGPETRAKMSAASKGRKMSPENVARMIQRLKGHVVREETRAKISAKAKGRTHTEEVRARLAAASRGKFWSQEKKDKVSAANKGKKKTPEHMAKVVATKRMKPSSRSPYGYKGVQKCEGRFRARIGKRSLGVFPTPEAAALAFNKAAIELWGEKTFLNKVDCKLIQKTFAWD